MVKRIGALVSFVLAGVGLASAASAVVTTPIGNPINACDPQSGGCYGTVYFDYSIGTYEVTNAQYAEFLNAKAASDPLALYNTGMGSGTGGITRTGAPGSYSYSVIAGRGDMPVNFVSFYDALRFANWLNNGQGPGDTETGAYTFSGATTVGARNAAATTFLTSEDEWYKAAYYNPSSASYFDYPAGSNTVTTCAAPTGVGNSGNCGYPSPAVGDLTTRGSYTGSASPYGTFDQGGNVWEWNEALILGGYRGVRAGSFYDGPGVLAASYRSGYVPATQTREVGFRITVVPAPEPGSNELVFAGVLGVFGLAGWRRVRD